MAIKFEKVTAGMTLYDIHRYKLQHVKMTRLGSWTVKVIEVDIVNRRALCSWNGNAPQWKPAGYFAKLYATIPPSKQAELDRGSW